MDPKQRQQRLIIGVIAVIAVLAVAGLILASGRPTASDIDFSALPNERAADGGFVLGNPDAPITVIEFADYGCPHCQEYKPTIDRFIKEYVVTGQAKFEYRTFPTAGGATTEFLGGVAECVDDQQPGAFWQATERFYQLAMSGRFSQQMARTLAEEMGLDYSELLNCQGEADQVRTDVALGQRVGVSGTPAVMVRYGDSEPTFINVGGRTFDSGAVPFEAIAQVVQQSQPSQ